MDYEVLYAVIVMYDEFGRLWVCLWPDTRFHLSVWRAWGIS